MITDAANRLADIILDKYKSFGGMASQSACEYARTDNPESKASYDKYNSLSDAYYQIHSVVCQHLHAVEAEMSRKVRDSIAAKEADKP